MESSWSTSIEKLMAWRAGSWHKYDSITTKWTLHLVHDLFVITAGTKVFESLSFRNKIKGIYKGDILILLLNNIGQDVRKIKFQIKNNVTVCLERLGQYFPLISYNTIHSITHENVFESRYRNIEDVLKNAVEKIGAIGTLPLPTEFYRFVKICLLDPNMPQIIADTQKIFVDMNINKNI